MEHQDNYEIKTNYVHKIGTTTLFLLYLQWLTDTNVLKTQKEFNKMQFHGFLK